MTGRPELHLVTDERLEPARLRTVVAQAVQAGVDVVQVRDKQASTRALLALVHDLADIVAGSGARLLVNDRVDVALAARHAGVPVAGVHLGQGDLPPDSARTLLGPGAIIGWSASTPAEVVAAAAFPPGTLDYLGLGVLRATGTKPDHPAPQGVAGLGALARAASLPCVAIGGVGVDDVALLRAAGLHGVAVVSAISAAAQPGAAAGALRAALDAAVAP